MPLKFNPTTGKLDLVNTASGGSITPDTRANLLASSPTSSGFVTATDTKEGLYYDAENTQWYEVSLPLVTSDADPTPGSGQYNDKNGYGEWWIDGKRITNLVIGAYNKENPPEGAVRIRHEVTPKKIEFFLQGVWQDSLYDIKMITSPETSFVHTPQNTQIEIRYGDSLKVGLNNNPIISNYQVTPGAYPPRKILNGNLRS